MENGSKCLKSENQALGQLKVLENTLKTMTDTIKKCDEYEEQIKEYEKEKKKYEKEKEESEKEKKEYEKEKIELEKQIKTNEDFMQQLRAGFEQQKNRADICEKTCKELQQKLQQAEQKIKELEQSVPIQPQRCIQLGIKRIAVQPLPNPQPQKIPNISQKNPSGQYVNWNLAHERNIGEKCYYSIKLTELSVIEAINKGCVIDTNISTMYRVNRFNRFPGNGRYLDISLSELAVAKCKELTNFNGAVNFMSQTTLKALVDLLYNRDTFNATGEKRFYFESGYGLTWNNSL